MSRVRQASVNMVSSALGYIVPMVANVLATPFLLRHLGNAAFGLQSLVGVIIGYFAVMDMGLEIPIVKLLSEQASGNQEPSRLLSTTLKLYAAIGVVGMLAIVGCARWFARSLFKVPDSLVGDATTVFRLAGIGFLGSMGVSWGRALAMGLQRFDIACGVYVTLNVIAVLLGVGAVHEGFGVVGYVAARVGASLAAMPVYLWLGRKVLPNLHITGGIDRTVLRRVSGYVGYGAVNRAVGSIVGRLDQTLIGAWVGVAAAGVYSVPFLVVNSLGSMVSYMLSFVFPLASELHGGGQTNLLSGIFVKATRFSAAVSGMIFAPLVVLGGPLLRLWVPSIAHDGTPILCLLAIAFYIGTLCTSTVHGIVLGTGYIRQFTIYATTRNCVLAVACLVLIPRYGAMGGAVAVLSTALVDVCYMIYSVKRYLRLDIAYLFRESYAKPITLSICLGALCYSMRRFSGSWGSLTVTVIIAELIFVGTCHALGVFGATERRVVAGLLTMMMGRSRRA